VDNRVRIAVVGVGHLGKHHVRLLAQNPLAELVGVADTNEENLTAATSAHGVPGHRDFRELLGRVDAVCVAVPTCAHLEVAGCCLESGVDVLVEKPIAPTAAEGRKLVELASRTDRILQVGHVERFNPALDAVREMGLEPRYIESHRLAPFSFRSVDIGVVLDLMIHDIDLVLTMVKSDVATVEAYGGAVFTPAEDMASAILKFHNGAVAHLTANRVALRPMRRMRLFSRDCYASLDFQSSHGTFIRKNPGWNLQQLDVGSVDPSKIEDLWKYVYEGLLTVKELDMDVGNPLDQELTAFMRSVQDRSRPVVGGEEGCAAVAVAEQVLAAIARNTW
jgi:predicted dehydrogenase